MRIGFASEDWASPGNPGGACHARVITPAQALASAGHEVYVGFGVGAHRSSGLLTVLGQDNHPLCEPPDVMVLQRWMHQDAPAAIAGAVAAGQAVVNDVDDHYEGLAQSNLAFASTHPSNNPTSNREHYRRALAASSMITVSTPFLADRMAQHRRPVRLIRNAIDLGRYTPHPVRDTSERLTVGWVGATGWRSGDLEVLQGVLAPFLAAGGHEFLHAGAMQGYPDAGPLVGLPDGTPYTARPAREVWSYPEMFEGIDIGIVPLSDVSFNSAKSAIKGMEYAASGIPYISSDTPEYRWYAGGVLAQRPRHWIRALERMTDPEVRRAQAEYGLERVRAESIQTRWTDWEQAYMAAAALSLRAFAP